MYSSVLTKVAGDHSAYQGVAGAHVALLKLAAELDQSAPSSGNPVDATLARIESLLGAEFAPVVNEMRQRFAQEREAFARGN
jgi:hypothetical protein